MYVLYRFDFTRKTLDGVSHIHARLARDAYSYIHVKPMSNRRAASNANPANLCTYDTRFT